MGGAVKKWYPDSGGTRERSESSAMKGTGPASRLVRATFRYDLSDATAWFQKQLVGTATLWS